MQSVLLKDEATTLVNTMNESQLKYVIQFMKFINQSKDFIEDHEERDKKDFELINAAAASINQGAEENLDFQADFWGDE